jgi:YecR-like lipoprotein
VALLGLLFTGCARTIVHKVPVATSGSKADGTIRLAYEQAAGEEVIPEWARAHDIALKRCQAWGYSRVDEFAGVLTQCTEYGQGLWVNGAPPGVCAHQIIYKDFQCLD